MPKGRVAGALVGVIDLTKPGFLDRVTRSRYGRTGGHVLVAPAGAQGGHRQRQDAVLQALAPPGATPCWTACLAVKRKP
jgi:hypothetical protein